MVMVMLMINSGPRPFWRNRIRVTLIHDKEHAPRIEVLDKRKPVVLNGWDRLEADEYAELESQSTSRLSSPSNSGVPRDSLIPIGVREYMTQTTLPIRALNEVFIGEALSARVSEYDISIDGEKYVRQKSSGVTCSTGTGSSSWLYQINRLSTETVADVLACTKRVVFEHKQKLHEEEEKQHRHRQQQPEHEPSMNVRSYSFRGSPVSVSRATETHELDELQGCIPSLAHKVAELYNASIPIRPDDTRMAYVVRDPLSVFNVSKPRGLAKQIQIRSTMLDAHVVFDAGWMFPLRYGDVVDLTIVPSDALRCISLMDHS
ncbi:unnamed protein product [Echinostoma caproni]|uniref:CABIT domain-containing protein n=1 Tax=Echinostoma caproni TaxID=27848 RepID=A0A183ARA4_9TREM|nr:unnamed protein product [Echinostoma caproni]